MNFDLISSISRYILREESRGKEEIAGHGRPPCNRLPSPTRVLGMGLFHSQEFFTFRNFFTISLCLNHREMVKKFLNVKNS
jgi:hypothetical protein